MSGRDLEVRSGYVTLLLRSEEPTALLDYSNTLRSRYAPDRVARGDRGAKHEGSTLYPQTGYGRGGGVNLDDMGTPDRPHP